jgi:hypothetical protein
MNSNSRVLPASSSSVVFSFSGNFDLRAICDIVVRVHFKFAQFLGKSNFRLPNSHGYTSALHGVTTGVLVKTLHRSFSVWGGWRQCETVENLVTVLTISDIICHVLS